MLKEMTGAIWDLFCSCCFFILCNISLSTSVVAKAETLFCYEGP